MTPTQSSENATNPALLEMRNISKAFPGIKALDDVSLTLSPGETLGIIGENGAGKSTLIKMLGGAHLPNNGQILLDGNHVELTSPVIAQQLGIGVIYQEFNLVPFLSVRDNIFLGRAHHRFQIVNRRSENQAVHEIFQRLGAEICPEKLVGSLSIAEQQMVEIAKSLVADVRILVMDEPTATLTTNEVNNLFRIIRELRQNGIALVYISHRLDEILEITDRVVVLRDGKLVGQRPVEVTSRRDLVELMVGRSLASEYPQHSRTPGATTLQVTDLCRKPHVRSVTFSLRRGEILGITGLVGAGRTELARLLAGADLPDSGNISIDGRDIRIDSPRDAIRHGICLLTEDRKAQGLILNHSVQHNFGLPNLDHLSRRGIVKHLLEANRLATFAEQIQIKLSHPRQLVGQLSGGNQQKIVLAKWLEKNCQIMIVDEPTRGIDVGAKYEIYLLFNELAKQGKAIIMISSELEEILGMSDRILVMRHGSIAGEVEKPECATQSQIMALAAH